MTLLFTPSKLNMVDCLISCVKDKQYEWKSYCFVHFHAEMVLEFWPESLEFVSD